MAKRYSELRHWEFREFADGESVISRLNAGELDYVRYLLVGFLNEKNLEHVLLYLQDALSGEFHSDHENPRCRMRPLASEEELEDLVVLIEQGLQGFRE